MPAVPSVDDLGDPEFKLWMRNQGRGGAGGQRPGPGGGFAAFGGGMNTLAGGSALGLPAFLRKTPFQNSAMPQFQAAAAGMPMTSLRQGASAGAFTGSQQGPMGGPSAAPTWGQGSNQPATSSPGALTAAQMAQIAAAPMWRRFALAAEFARQNQANQAAGTEFAPAPGTGTWTSGNRWQDWINNNDPGWGGLQGYLLGLFGQEGAFSPTGNPAILDEIQRRGQQSASSAANRSRLQSQVMGFDPSAAASYAAESQLRGQGDTARSVSDAMLQQLMQQQQFGQQIAMGYINPQQQAFMQNWVQRQQPQPNQWAQALGGIGGSVLGSWLSPGGIWGRSR